VDYNLEAVKKMRIDQDSPAWYPLQVAKGLKFAHGSRADYSLEAGKGPKLEQGAQEDRNVESLKSLTASVDYSSGRYHRWSLGVGNELKSEPGYQGSYAKTWKIHRRSTARMKAGMMLPVRAI
jgi:hypothetical protein